LKTSSRQGATVDGFTVRNGRALPGGDQNGGGAYITDGNITFADCTFSTNVAADRGGAIYYGGNVDNDHFMSNCTFIANEATNDGGAVNFDDPGRLTVVGSTFSFNRSGSDGGGLRTDEEVSLIDSTFYRKRSTDGGGGAQIEGSGSDSVVIENTVFNANVSSNTVNNNDDGGGLRIGNGVLDIRDATFLNNYAGDQGGGLYINAAVSPFTLDGTLFQNNIANDGDGGGLRKVGNQTMTLNDCHVQNNTAANDQGGGAYIDGDVTLTGCRFFANNSSQQGGALYIGGEDNNILEPTLISNCVFAANQSGNNSLLNNDDDSGAVHVNNGYLYVYDTAFSNNIAQSAGGAMSLPGGLDGLPLFQGCRFIGNQCLGGAIGAGSYNGGGAINTDKELQLLNCVFGKNRQDGTLGAGGGAIYMNAPDNSRSLFENVTFAYNHSTDAGGAIRTDRGDIDIFNCIFWQNRGVGSTDEIFVNTGDEVNMDYCIIDVTEVDASGTFIQGGNIFLADPLFADVVNCDFHVLSPFGRWLTSANAFVYDSFISMGIDSGDPAYAFTNEVSPNGGTINLGAYGNTPEASLSGFVSPLFVQTLGPTNITSGSATLIGQLIETNAAPTTVRFYYGTVNGGTNKAAWPGSVTVNANASPGVFSNNLTGLSGGQIVYYIAYASNALGEAWGPPSALFITDLVNVQSVRNGSEAFMTNGLFSIYRPSATIARAITVQFTLTGTATHGTDYAWRSLTATIPAGQTNVLIDIQPIDDLISEADETVVLNLLPGDYAIGPQSNATVLILEDETPIPEIVVLGIDGSVIPDGQTLTLSADGTDFGSVEPWVEHTFTISNLYAGNVLLTGAPLVEVLGPNAGEFVVVSQPATNSLGLAESATFTIRFTPLAESVRTATVSIANNDSNEDPYTFNLSGFLGVNTNAEWRMSINFCGYTRTNTLTNFTALLVLSTNTPGFRYDQFAYPATGSDLRFTDFTLDNPIHYEIENWDTNGESHIWLKIPFFNPGFCMVMMWGNTNLTFAPPYTTNGSVWEERFEGV
ncbi:MAG: choice-of-anchor D domain-containing protein, partial [Verrucomicrobiota bacterium]